jgi:hypothetical protein
MEDEAAIALLKRLAAGYVGKIYAFAMPWQD